MDNVTGAGAGLSAVHGYRRFGIETPGLGNDERIFQSAWTTPWKTQAAFCAQSPRLPETEDGEDYMSGLAEEIAQCMLHDNDDGARSQDCSALKNIESVWGAQPFLSTSPQSTLTGISGWDLLSPGGSSNGGLSSGVSSPPTPVASSQIRKEEENALDLLYAELLRLKMEDEIKTRQQQLIYLKQQQQYHQLLWKLRQRQAATVNYDVTDALNFNQCSSPLNLNSSSRVHGNPNLFIKSKIRNGEASQARVRKQVNGSWTGVQSQGTRQRSWSAEHSNQMAYATSAYASNGSLQKSVNGSGMRAVFLGTPGSRESGGTGVFLPRRLGSGHDTKRKPSCSTVLLPSRIVQALNLNVEDTLSPNPLPANLALRRDSVPARGRQVHISGEAMPARDNWLGIPAAASLQEVAPDICLPKEWTY